MVIVHPQVRHRAWLRAALGALVAHGERVVVGALRQAVAYAGDGLDEPLVERVWQTTESERVARPRLHDGAAVRQGDSVLEWRVTWRLDDVGLQRVSFEKA